MIGEQPWHSEVDRLRADGLSVKQIALRIGMSHGVVGAYLKPYFCACGNKRHQNAAECVECFRARISWRHSRFIEIVAGMFNDGWTGEEMCEVTGRAIPATRAAITRLGPEIDEARKLGLVGYRHHGWEATS